MLERELRTKEILEIFQNMFAEQQQQTGAALLRAADLDKPDLAFNTALWWLQNQGSIRLTAPDVYTWLLTVE